MLTLPSAAPVSAVRFERCPSEPIRFHEYAELFPMLEGAEYEAFREDIRQNGVREPIVMYGGYMLDGRNRYMAARSLRLEYPVVEYEGDDPLAFVVSRNLTRRHLSDSQRASIAAKMANMPLGGAVYRSANLQTETPRLSQADAAAMLSISERSVASAAKVIRDGAPELVAALDRGEVSVAAAADVSELPIEEQLAVLAEEDPKALLAAAKGVRSRRTVQPPLTAATKIRVEGGETPTAVAEDEIEKRRVRKVSTQTEQAEFDRQRNAARDALPEAIKKAEAARSAARGTKKKPASVTAEDRVVELEEANRLLEEEIATLRAECSLWAPMKALWESGGFEAVIAGRDEQIRVLGILVETESGDKAKWKRRADYWKAEALKLGWSDDVVIPLDGEPA